MASEHRLTGKHYVGAWIALVALTLLSFGGAQLPLGAFAPVVALGIAGIKALIVVLIFMHLLEATFAIRVVGIVVVSFIVLLCLGMAADVLLR